MKPRHHLYLDDALTEQLDALARKPGSSKSAIVADALRSYLARRGPKELDDLLKTRLDRISRQLGRIERAQQDRKSVVSGKREAVRVELGGRRIIKKKQKTRKQAQKEQT